MAVCCALAGETAGVFAGPEQDALARQFDLRGTQTADGVAVVAIDGSSLDRLQRAWPLPRRMHAQAIDRLRRAGVARVVYDVQFTEPTRPRDDVALLDAVRRAPGTVLATTETDGHGHSGILGGDENLARAGAHAGAANLGTERGDVIQRFPYSSGGLRSLGVVAAAGEHVRLDAGDFPPRGALIDFRGPPGTVPTVSFADVLDPRSDLRVLRGRVVVVGATAATLQDVHATPTADDRLMSGPEIQANAVWTAMHGLPLRTVPHSLLLVIMVLLGAAPAIAALCLRPWRAALVPPVLLVLYVVAALVAFRHGAVLPVAGPVAALVLGAVGAMATAFLAERDERRRVAHYNVRLEEEVRARTQEVRDTELEVIRRLGAAVERRDEETGEHIDRMSALCRELALAAGMAPADAELLHRAAVLHDVGKIGIPDTVLRKAGAYEPDERALMETHTTIGSELLRGSRAPLVQLAETVARCHHECWDGSGYPVGLSGADIPLPARVASICDVFDALLSRRPYKDAWPLQEAVAEIASRRGRDFDPRLTDIFVDLVPRLDPRLLSPDQFRTATPIAIDRFTS